MGTCDSVDELDDSVTRQRHDYVHDPSLAYQNNLYFNMQEHGGGSQRNAWGSMSSMNNFTSQGYHNHPTSSFSSSAPWAASQATPRTFMSTNHFTLPFQYNDSCEELSTDDYDTMSEQSLVPMHHFMEEGTKHQEDEDEQVNEAEVEMYDEDDRSPLIFESDVYERSDDIQADDQYSTKTSMKELSKDSPTMDSPSKEQTVVVITPKHVPDTPLRRNTSNISLSDDETEKGVSTSSVTATPPQQGQRNKLIQSESSYRSRLLRRGEDGKEEVRHSSSCPRQDNSDNEVSVNATKERTSKIIHSSVAHTNSQQSHTQTKEGTSKIIHSSVSHTNSQQSHTQHSHSGEKPSNHRCRKPPPRSSPLVLKSSSQDGIAFRKDKGKGMHRKEGTSSNIKKHDQVPAYQYSKSDTIDLVSDSISSSCPSNTKVFLKVTPNDEVVPPRKQRVRAISDGGGQPPILKKNATDELKSTNHSSSSFDRGKNSKNRKTTIKIPHSHEVPSQRFRLQKSISLSSMDDNSDAIDSLATPQKTVFVQNDDNDSADDGDDDCSENEEDYAERDLRRSHEAKYDSVSEKFDTPGGSDNDYSISLEDLDPCHGQEFFPYDGVDIETEGGEEDRNWALSQRCMMLEYENSSLKDSEMHDAEYENSSLKDMALKLEAEVVKLRNVMAAQQGMARNSAQMTRWTSTGGMGAPHHHHHQQQQQQQVYFENAEVMSDDGIGMGWTVGPPFGDPRRGGALQNGTHFMGTRRKIVSPSLSRLGKNKEQISSASMSDLRSSLGGGVPTTPHHNYHSTDNSVAQQVPTTPHHNYHSTDNSVSSADEVRSISSNGNNDSSGSLAGVNPTGGLGGGR
eukprot:CAMPEP_0114407508 /NCGR_PEP_ID=MMETSP0102-20121206/21983_1 /TAXON_ID=38822 ORGANISM="Pteridomonas danica, Strain PT" /NCGR_SAMPLE_ID=MMETSP0102 /ASSEMBLY_ACC=CAM_ASM_000212 /LENGTH=848 /DNA_ID=CAMNT_0001573987 /DNA_START=29 /DNA_END=2574 /DNA_ORIENTATION=+